MYEYIYKQLNQTYIKKGLQNQMGLNVSTTMLNILQDF